MKAAVVEAVVDRVEDGDKEKKKRRPRNRRPKQNPSTSVSGSSVNELPPECLGNGTMENHVTTSLKQHHLGMNPPYEQGLTKASNLAFSSLPTMHIVESLDVQSPENQRLLPSDFGGKMFAKSCPEPAACGGSPGILTNKGSPPQHFEGYSQRKYFPPHWSMEDVNDALEKGDAFKALFRVNAHNRIEAYCKIDGVPTDVLIGGLAEQNRAVEGDIVAIKIDPLPLWTRMKGSAGACKSSAPVEDLNLTLEDTAVGYNCKGKAKVDEDCEYDSRTSYLLPERGSCSEESTYLRDSTHSEPIGQSCCDHVAGKYQLASDSSQAGSSTEQNVVKTPVERMCAIISSFPSKRPTGRVVAIIERSKRRDAVVGFLNVKKWISYREFCRKDMKKNKSLSYSDHEYIQMTPTDPRFPKMVVLVRNLPDAIKKRLENGDETIEKELVSARVDEWGEESLAPQALILHAFGHGTEVQPHIKAILFENAINSSEFSPESLSCLPRLPWEVPREEFQTRKDLRNLCIFTIDPSTATDLDDALSVENFSNGISRVGIHIADVSYFVLPDTPLDEEAQSRSTSVYMTHRKIPMLPSSLSENIGSLNPGAEKLSFSIFLDLNNAGDVVDRWIGRTVIRSCCKLSYEHAQDIIDGNFNSESFDTFKDGCPQIHGQFEWSDVIRSVKNLYEVSKTLKERRFSEGALQLDNSKVVILFDEYGDPYDSLFSERKESNSLVEEFMLLANRIAAEVISRAFPNSALLRRHPEPNMRKLKEFEAFCSKHGLELDTSSSGRFHQSLERIREKLKDDSVLFNILMNYATKPMQLAIYFCSGELKHKENDWGHYGLAVPLYTHFTSPLRRYPDIVVHRTLAAAIESEELYLEHQRLLNNLTRGDKFRMRCFSLPLSLLGNDYFKSTLLSTDVMGGNPYLFDVVVLQFLCQTKASCHPRSFIVDEFFDFLKSNSKLSFVRYICDALLSSDNCVGFLTNMHKFFQHLVGHVHKEELFMATCSSTSCPPFHALVKKLFLLSPVVAIHSLRPILADILRDDAQFIFEIMMVVSMNELMFLRSKKQSLEIGYSDIDNGNYCSSMSCSLHLPDFMITWFFEFTFVAIDFGDLTLIPPKQFSVSMRLP